MADENKEYMPRLRFPEFPNQAGWERMPLGSICHLKPGKFIEADKIYPCWREGLVPCYGGNGLRGYVESANYKVCYPLIGRQGALCGNIQMPETEFFATEHAIVAESNKNINRKFLFYLLSKLNINKLATGQAQPGISVDIVKKIPVLIPPLGEQQKIANCLSSLDELIDAHEQKRDALVEHKKGLMQRLFPAEGETTPRWRFPEFKKGGEWENKHLGDVVDFLSGFPFDGKDIVTNTSGCKLLRGINITEGRIRHSSEIDRCFCGETSSLEKYRLVCDDIVIGMDGSKVGKNSALITKIDEGALLVQRVARLRISKQNSTNYIFQNIRSKRFIDYVDKINTSSGIPHISGEQIKSFVISMPHLSEQQKIADCLSSLDARIEAEEAKIASLRELKQGLMQRLFPQSL